MATETDNANLPVRAKEPSMDLTPRDSADAISALDALAAGEAGDSNTPPADNNPPPADANTPPDNNTPPADNNNQEPPPSVDKNTPPPADGNTPPPDNKDKDKGGAEADPLDAVALPPHTKPKTAESFGKLKQVAREQITAARNALTEANTKAEELQKQLDEFKAKSSDLPEEIKSELEELRKFKLAHDVESDPTFRQHDDAIKKNTDLIYSKLKGAGMSDEKIEEIKKMGGPEALDWEPLLPNLPYPVRMAIEAKLVENENLRDKKADALSAAKSNAEGFLKDRAGREERELTEEAEKLTKQLPWMSERQVPANAKPEEKKSLEAGNAFAKESREMLKKILSDRSAKNHADLAVSTIFAYRQKQELQFANNRLAEQAKQIENLTKERNEAVGKLEKIKKAEQPGLRNQSGVTPPAPAVKKGVLSTPTESVLDELAKEEAAKAANQD